MTISSTRWRSASVLLFCALALVTVLYWPALSSMVALWRSDAFSHGILVIPTSLYLIWTRRKVLASVPPAPTFWAVPVVVVSAFGWLLGALTATAVVQHFFVVMLIIGLVWGLLGTAVARLLLLPLAFLFFAVPIGEGLIPDLQDFSARFAVRLLDLSGIPVLLEGRYITVPYGRWEVAEACSGIRYLVSSLAVGFVFAGIAYRSWVRRVVFFLASAVVPVVANGLRVYGIVLLGYLGGERLAASVDHKIAGLVFFSFIMFLLLAVGMRWRETDRQPLPPTSGVVQNALVSSPSLSSYFTPSSASCVFVLILAASLAPFSARLLWSVQARSGAAQRSVPVVSVPWTISQSRQVDWQPSFLAPASEVSQIYESGPHSVKLYVAYYPAGQQGGKLVSSGNQFYDSARWLRTGEGRGSATIDRQAVEMLQISAKSQDSSLVVWHCYWVDGTFTSNGYFAKLLLAKARLFGSRQGAAAIAVAAEDSALHGDGPAILRDFLSHLALRDSLDVALKNKL